MIAFALIFSFLFSLIYPQFVLTHSHSLSLTRTHTHTLLSRTLSLTHSRTHSHTHTHTHPLTHTHHIHRSNSPSSSLTTTTTSSLWRCCRLLRSWRRCGTLLSNGTVEEALLLLHRLENLERAHERLVDVHHCTRVVELSAVVGCREYRHQLALSEKLVPILHNLVSADDEVKVEALEELVNHLLAESVAHATVVLTPPLNVLIWVRPEKVADHSRVRHVCGPRDVLNLLQRLQLG
mmetsp:Transcript_11629/g.26319  ORF Transcript_11629/g.26319 Transcript_11629/m.26319 type:complete len:236 (+) Transcript_11629:236-943(+)